MNSIEYSFIEKQPGETVLQKAEAYLDWAWGYRDQHQGVTCEQARCEETGFCCRCERHGQAVLDNAYRLWRDAKETGGLIIPWDQDR